MNFLTPFGFLYGRITDLRNLLYDRGVFKSHDLGARTISVGNLTTGGTGKTPLVDLVAKILAENREKVCILTRGYGRVNPHERVLVSDGESVLVDAEIGGDEPVELAKRLVGKAVVVADADRVAAAKWAKEKFGVTAFVLDDGFQHRRAKRDLDIVCIDATNPCGNGRILPAGTLRESFKHLRRASAIVITRANLIDSTEELVARMKKRNDSAPIFVSENHISGLQEFQEFHAKTQIPQGGEPKQTNFLAFCALGNSENFFRQLRNDGYGLLAIKGYRDHHKYTQADLDQLESTAKKAGANALLTTGKDAVKLKSLTFGMPCYVVEIETCINDEKGFRDMITASS